jgi:hypothetical protein
MPAIARGRALAGKADFDNFSLAGMCMICHGRDDAELAEAIVKTKKQIAFYASTPAYRRVLDVHGWGDLQPELTRLSKAGRWDEMGEAIDDDILNELAIVGDPQAVGIGLKERWGDLIHSTTLYVTFDVPDQVLEEVVAAAR